MFQHSWLDLDHYKINVEEFFIIHQNHCKAMQLTSIFPSGGCPGRKLTQKITRVMRLTAIILLAAGLTANAAGHSQTVTLDLKDVPIQRVFREVVRQTGTSIMYNEEIFNNAAPVTIKVVNATVPEVLSICLNGQPYSYEIIDRTVVIQPKQEDSRSIDSQQSLPSVDVKGIVLNENGEPIAGVTVMVKGTGQATSTDANGEFMLPAVDKNAVLIFSATNIETSVISLHGRTTLKLTFKTKVSPLDEVQIIAYGTTTERVATGNVNTVTAKEIGQQPVNNPLLALEGQVPGLFITQSTGIPGSGVGVQIQGQNSLRNGNDPLYIIDGVPYTSELLPDLDYILGNSGNNGSPAGSGNPLSFINPNDIESISVLKDADATAIYGSRAANGAILITTKKGLPGKTRVNVNVQNGWGHITRELSLMNTQQYLEMRHEAFKNDGLTPGPTDYDINGDWDTTRYTDWQKVLLGGTAQYKTATMSVSGGSENTQYLVSSTYQKETTVFPGNFSDQKGSVNFNINSSTPNQKFKFQLSGNYMTDVNHLPGYDMTFNTTLLSPNAPPLYTKDGKINWALDSSGNSTFSSNPISSLYTKDTRKTNNLISHALLSYQISRGLQIRSSFGYTNLQGNEIQTFPLTAFNPQYLAYTMRQANYENTNINSWIIEPQISYNRRIGNGKLEALAGATIEQNNNTSQQVQGSGYNSDLSLQNIGAAATLTAGYYNIASIYKYNAAFGKLNYNWEDKYIIDLTARRDGSSRFGSANEFHDFGAIGAAWIFSSDNFVKKNLSFLSFGKLSASYGTTGNDQIGDYQFRTLYSPTYQAIPYQGITGLAPNGLSNPYLQWESTKKLYFDMNLGFFKDRILLNAGYAVNRSSNQLLQYSLPFIAGFYGVSRNLPATVQNTSLEFTVKTTNIRTNNFSWTSNLNLTIPRNKLIAFPDLQNSGYQYEYTIGKSITGFKVFHLLGVDPATGVFQFLGGDGKPTFLPQYTIDQPTQISMDPKFYGGFQNNFRYKGFELDIFFQFVKQDGRTYPFGNLPGYFYGGSGNQPVWVLNRWQKPGDKAANSKFSTYASGNLFDSYEDATQSQAAFGDASFIRLKNLSLSWQIPDAIIKKANVQNCQIYVHAQNLITITKFQGMDPESQSVNSIPPLRVLTVGLQFGL